MNFYTKAMNEIRLTLRKRRKIKPPSFFLFSDDIPVVREYFMNNNNITTINSDGLVTFHFASDPNYLSNLEDFYLMSKCHPNIISGKSFGWWAAYLNKYKIVRAAHHKTEFFGSNDYKNFQFRHHTDWISLDQDQQESAVL
jgi:hypothetical protein